MQLSQEETDAINEVRDRVRSQRSEAHERLILTILNRAIAVGSIYLPAAKAVEKGAEKVKNDIPPLPSPDETPRSERKAP